ncbi:hypothetical protein PENSTE_c025G06250 [Penicillium steckii]|uniref:Uncharacterized protein n=1 Tax=Penicillium steckii TaxID=303698 RepID=A0A1V6SQ52_9EURO|nr:hypothetical protein PENSTE_c025G06250 [Penicillium steckii]
MLDLKHSDHTKYAFWITSSSMRSAVALLNDSSVHVTYELYCKKDPVITVIVRPERDPSPNSSQTPSAEDSLRERQKVSGQQKLQNVSWTQDEAERGVSPEDVVVTAMTTYHHPVQVTVNKDIWETLFREHSRLEFLEIWDSTHEKKILRMEYTSSLFQDYPKRLQMLVDPYFIGKPYFSEAASQAIPAIPFESDTLKGKIEKLQEENCSSHCLASMLLHAFGLQ